MLRRRILLIRLIFASLLVGMFVNESAATEYVWARSGYGALPTGHNGTSFSNGYGGYYVPKNAYGNNHESLRPFTNPNGFIVPTAPQQAQSIPKKPNFQQKLKRFWSH